MTALMLLLLAQLALSNVSDNNNQALPADHQFRAAKYSTVHDNADFLDLVPMMDHSTTIYIYLVQYGDSLMIELRQQEGGSPFGLSMITSWDYRNRIVTSRMIHGQASRYYEYVDTIQFSIEDHNRSVKSICASDYKKASCDSLMITSLLDDKEYYVFVNDTISNLPSHYLFYPDVKYLPYKIVTPGKTDKTMNFEEMLYGKEVIDSLVQLFQYEGYEKITEEELNNAMQIVPVELQDVLNRIENKMKE